MARGDYTWYGDWMDDHYQPWIDHKKRTSDAWDAYQKADKYRSSYLGGRTAGTQGEFEEWQRRAALSDAAFSKYDSLLEQEPSFTEGAKTAFDAWSNFKPESEPEPTKPDVPYSEPVESKDTGGGFIKNEDTGEVTNIGESKYHRIINEDGTGTIFPITESTGTIWSDFYQTEDAPIGDTMGEIDIARGREPNPDDRPYKGAPKPGDPDYTPPPSFPGQDIPTKIASGWDSSNVDEWSRKLLQGGFPTEKDRNEKLKDDPYSGSGKGRGMGDRGSAWDISGEIAQIASSEGLQPGSLQDNIARDIKQQRLAQETGTQIRQLETDRRSSEPTLAERLGGRAGAKQRSEGRETTDLLSNILDWQGLDNKGATLRDKIAPIGNVLSMIPEGLNKIENVAVGAIPLIKSFKHTAGWTQGTDENPARIHHTPFASREARDRANEYINSLGEEAIKKIRDDGRLSTDQLSELTTAIQPNQTGTEWNFTMNSLANPRIELEDNPRQEGEVQVKRLFDNFQFDSEKDVSFDLPGKPIQAAVELFQNQNIKNDPLRATYELDQSNPGNTRNTRRMPVYTEFDYTWDNIKHALTPKGPNKGRSGANNKMKARGSTYNPTLNRNVLRIPN